MIFRRGRRAARLDELIIIRSNHRKGLFVSRLPPIGAEIPMSALAVDTPLRIRDEAVSVDFRGGLKERVDVNPEDPHNSVKLRMVGYKWNAELPADGGRITIEQDDVDTDPQSRLRLNQENEYEHVCVLSFIMTSDRPDTEPLILNSKNPATLIAKLSQYPPKGDLHTLQKPVDFATEDDPDTVVTILKFPLKMGGL
jgi:hypothetical protein